MAKRVHPNDKARRSQLDRNIVRMFASDAPEILKAADKQQLIPKMQELVGHDTKFRTLA